MLDVLQETLWRAARLFQFQQYVGNPDPTGPSRTSYRFTLSLPKHPSAPRPPVVGGVNPAGLAALLVLMAAGLMGGAPRLVSELGVAGIAQADGDGEGVGGIGEPGWVPAPEVLVRFGA